MLSRNELKYFSSLRVKKFRDKENKFIAEGKKIVEEALLSNYKCEIVVVIKQFAEFEKSFIKSLPQNLRIETVPGSDFKKLKDTVSPQGIAAVFSKVTFDKKNIDKVKDSMVICLDNISDPGNLGTIIRNCDWFGFKSVLLTENCADLYNPKTIRAGMGSTFHLNIFEEFSYTDIEKLKKKGYRIICSDLDGEDMYNINISKNSILVFSNESGGPSKEILNLSDQKVTIPSYGKAESLNVASASAIILSAFREKIN
jgi:TrmH family RNA methyltransferase